MFGFFKKGKKADAARQEGGADSPALSPEAILLAARRKVEHEYLRDYYYKNPTGLVADVTDEFGLHNLYVNFMKIEKMRKFLYKPKDFLIDTGKTERDDYLVIAELPEPEEVGLCYRMYFLFDAKFEHRAFFTVEREEEGAQLYLWDEDKKQVPIAPIETGRWAEKTKEERHAELQLVNDVFYGVPEEERGKVRAEEPADEPAEAADEASAEAADEAPEAAEAPDEAPEMPAHEQPAASEDAAPDKE
jgi:hypothetical protein